MGVNGSGLYLMFFEELSRLGYIEGQNLEVERYLAKGAPSTMPTLPAMSSTLIPTLSFRKQLVWR